jgi:glycosyltransferase involved in cell wall biosynthesis
MHRHGTQRQLAGVLLVAHGRRWDATLCVLHPGYPLTEEVRGAGVPVVECGPAGPLDVRWLLRLRRLIRSGRFDVVHSSLWGCNVVTRVAAAGPGRPAVVVAERSVESWRSRGGRAIDRALRPLADGYIANSAAVAEFVAWAHGVPREQVRVIPNGVDGRVFHPPDALAARAGRPRIGSVGRLVRGKGLDVVLAALPAVLVRREAELVVVGEGEERPRLEEAARGLPVTFLGELPSPADVADFLRTLDVFVTASRWEGMPNAVLEALACGVPVVATSVPGMAEATGGRARLVPPDDPRALARALVAALADGRGGRGERLRLPTFDEVAELHRQAFEAARARRARAGGG